MHAHPDLRHTLQPQPCDVQASSIHFPVLSLLLSSSVLGLEEPFHPLLLSRASLPPPTRRARCGARRLPRTRLVKAKCVLHTFKAPLAHSHGLAPPVGSLVGQTLSDESRGTLEIQMRPVANPRRGRRPLDAWPRLSPPLPPPRCLICVSTSVPLAHVCVRPWVRAPNVRLCMYPCMYFSRPGAINKPLVRHFCPKRPIEITAAHLSGKCVPLGVIL